MFISISEAADKYRISEKKAQILCELGKIEGAFQLNGIWQIPEEGIKPEEKQKSSDWNKMNDQEICEVFSISKATLNNWKRLGKLVPDINGQDFSCDYIWQTVKEIQNNSSGKLKSRRNKKQISGNTVYKDYVSATENRKLVENLWRTGQLSDQEIPCVLAGFAVQLYYQKNHVGYEQNDVLDQFLKQDCEFSVLIQDLLSLGKDSHSETALAMRNQRVSYVMAEDTLGFIYLSLRDRKERKSTGAYYTPDKIVKRMIRQLEERNHDQIVSYCDPCCGTGNFLLHLVEKYGKQADIHGWDSDPLSVCLTRINLYLTDCGYTADELKSRIVAKDTLLDQTGEKFDVVIGNPPWGSDLGTAATDEYRKLYKVAESPRFEAYDLFVEKALSMLAPSGTLAFVLPEAILNVASHRKIRELILQKCSFRSVDYIGNGFAGVQCPAVLLQLRSIDPGSVRNCKVYEKNREFTIEKQRKISAQGISLNLSDQEYECIRKIGTLENCVTLKNHARFALGIVTGNNQKLVTSQPGRGKEVIVKGNDIYRYSIENGNHYIHFAPDQFQQCAPEEIYRAKEKLFYRFICEVPVFAYDDQQRLSLNSANIVVPMIEGLNIKYILGVLNSMVAAYWITRKFNSVKLLKSHIESIPIPVVSENKQRRIVSQVDQILKFPSDQDIIQKLDNDIASLYHLDEMDRKTIRESMKDKNLFYRK